MSDTLIAEKFLGWKRVKRHHGISSYWEDKYGGKHEDPWSPTTYDEDAMDVLNFIAMKGYDPRIRYEKPKWIVETEECVGEGLLLRQAISQCAVRLVASQETPEPVELHRENAEMFEK